MVTLEGRGNDLRMVTVEGGWYGEIVRRCSWYLVVTLVTLEGGLLWKDSTVRGEGYGVSVGSSTTVTIWNIITMVGGGRVW